jgi:flavin reductase (DIM6/NTAB) family NADH-FMN oxidoreductase RutF
MLAKYVGVSVLSAKQQDISQQFASHDTINWQNLAYTCTPNTNAPIINNAAAYMEAEVITKHDGGDHTIFILKLISCNYNLNEQPLLYFRGNYAALDLN